MNIPLGLTAAASADDVGIQKILLKFGATTLIISNEELRDIMKLVNFLEDCGLLINGVTQTIEYETKVQRDGFLGMLLGTLSPRLLGN